MNDDVIVIILNVRISKKKVYHKKKRGHMVNECKKQENGKDKERKKRNTS